MPRRLMTWLVFFGLVMAAGTLGVLAWARHASSATWSPGRWASRRSRSSACSPRWRPPTRTSRCSVGRSSATDRCSSRRACRSLTIILATELPFLQRILGTVSLSIDQWVVCIVVSLSLIVVEEASASCSRSGTSDEPAVVTVPAAASGRSSPRPLPEWRARGRPTTGQPGPGKPRWRRDGGDQSRVDVPARRVERWMPGRPGAPDLRARLAATRPDRGHRARDAARARRGWPTQSCPACRRSPACTPRSCAWSPMPSPGRRRSSSSARTRRSGR